LIPLFLLAMAITVDLGNFLIMRSQAWTLADAASLSGAGGLDVQQAGQHNFVLNPYWAYVRASDSYAATYAANRDRLKNMSFSLAGIEVKGATITVTVTGSVTNQFTPGLFGIGSYSTVVRSTARAATGIDKDLTLP
jgi:hypothetical protein